MCSARVQEAPGHSYIFFTMLRGEAHTNVWVTRVLSYMMSLQPVEPLSKLGCQPLTVPQCGRSKTEVRRPGPALCCTWLVAQTSTWWGTHIPLARLRRGMANLRIGPPG